MDYDKKIDIPFGAKNSELKGWEYTIPEGMEAEIKDGKVIVRQKESEDEKIRKEIIDFIEWADCRNAIRSDYNQAKRPAVWLAYLEKQKERKPAEWSDEEIRKILDDYDEGRDTYTSCIKRLKSLRPQPHWKPGEEQMAALEHFIRSWGESGTMSSQNTILCAAKSLYNDLKKL